MDLEQADSVSRMESLRLACRAAEIGPAVAAVRGFAATAGLPAAAAEALALAVDEALSNIVSHAGLPPDDAAIHVDAVADPQGVTVTVADRGPAFNPADHPVEAPSGGAEERAVGGLGLHLMRNLVSRLHYTREGPWNRLTLFRARQDAACGAGAGP